MANKLHDWHPDERPSILGSPSTPNHPTQKRIAYAVVALLLAITGGLGNAMVSANLPQMQGALGLDIRQANLLVAAYMTLASSANLFLIKFRQSYGPRRFAEVFLGIYLVTTVAHLFAGSFASAAFVRMVAGMSGCALSPLASFYFIQAFPKQYRGQALLFSLGFIAQVTQPLAYVLPAELLSSSEWHGLYLFESGLCLLAMCAVLALKIPPGDQVLVFEKLDAVTTILFTTAMALLCSALALGRYDWWTDAPWLGYALAASAGLFAIVFAIEHGRSRPIFSLKQLSTISMIRFFFVMMLVRVVLAEQGSGAVGLMRYMGLQNEELHGLYALIVLGSLLGIMLSTWIFKPQRLDAMICAGLVIMSIGAWLASSNVALSRPMELAPAQFIMALGSAFVVGPAFLSMLVHVARNMPERIVGFVMLFVMSQYMGGLIGSATLQTIQASREQIHATQLAEMMPIGDPMTQNISSTQLSDIIAREATVMSYNDIFALVAVVSLIAMLTYLLPAITQTFGRWVEATANRLTTRTPSRYNQ